MAELLPRVWLDGEIVPLEEARISPLDRGFLFGDAVYEAMPVCGGRIVGEAEHLARLGRSLDATGIRNPNDEAAWQRLFARLIEANGGGDMLLYLQVSRGADTGRDHRFPVAAQPTVLAMAMHWQRPRESDYPEGVAAALVADRRWARCDIKATSLLANVMARQEAAERDSAEAILHRDGWVTEGAASTIAIVTGGTLLAPPPDPTVLPSVTLQLVWVVAEREDIPRARRRFSVEELLAADEVIMLASSRELVPVGRVDDTIIGTGAPGPLWRRLFRLYQQAHHGSPPA
ncbi:MAG: D-amino acid aminotransferase [Gammaproteobacteria bacterium]|jgi:D-alanine transaminase|nr:D-amino acid aminotransferase [Gammaproteobacteria bacterium]